MLKRLLLHGLFVNQNPVFDLELRKLARTRPVPNLRRQLWRSMRIVYILGFVVWVVVFLLRYDSYQYYGSYTEYYWRRMFLDTSGIMFLLATALGVLVAIVCDFFYAFATASSVSDPVMLGQWETLRLTHLDEFDIIEGKYAATLIRSWRTTAFELAWRIAGFSFLLVPLILAVLDVRNWYRDMTRDGWTALAVMILTGILVVVSVILESILRARTFIALGLWISSAIHTSAMAVLAGIGVMLGVRLAQIATIAAITYGAVVIWANVNQYSDYSSPVTPTMIYILTYCAVIVSTIFLAYWGLQILALRRVTKRAFRSE